MRSRLHSRWEIGTAIAFIFSTRATGGLIEMGKGKINRMPKLVVACRGQTSTVGAEMRVTTAGSILGIVTVSDPSFDGEET